MRLRLALFLLVFPALGRAQLPLAVWFEWREPHIAILPDSSGTYFWVQTGAAGDSTPPRTVAVTFDPAKITTWLSGARAFLNASPTAADTPTIRSSEILHGTAGDGLYLLRGRANGVWADDAVLAVESPKSTAPVRVRGSAKDLLTILDSLQMVAGVTPYSEVVSQRVRVDEQTKFDTPARGDRGNMPPSYPLGLLRSGQDGLVIVSFVVSARGKVDLTTVKPFLVTHPAFLESVLTALPFMSFHPAILGGGEVDSRITMPFQFSVVKKP